MILRLFLSGSQNKKESKKRHKRKRAGTQKQLVKHLIENVICILTALMMLMGM